MIVLIDNYDSFTFNLFHYLGGLGADVVVHRNDKISVDDVIGLDPDADRPLARSLYAERSRHLPEPDREGGHDPADPGSLSGASGDRPGLRRPGGAGAGADPRQALRDPASGRRCLPRHQCAVQGDALSFAGGRAQHLPGRPEGRPRRPTTSWSWAWRIAVSPFMACSFIRRASLPSTAISSCGISSTSLRRGTPRPAGAQPVIGRRARSSERRL